jgi:hypothetical protein
MVEFDIVWGDNYVDPDTLNPNFPGSGTSFGPGDQVDGTLSLSIEEIKEEETIIETEVKIDKKKVILNSIARALKEMEKNNLQEKKRQIFSALRSL